MGPVTIVTGPIRVLAINQLAETDNLAVDEVDVD
jgi:hypothetical protein